MIRRSTIRHILLDLDGTLTDPKPGITGSFRFALQTLGLPAPPADELLWIIGPPLRQSFSGMGVPAARVEEALDLYRQKYRAGAMFDAPVYEGIPQALQSLSASGMKLILATSKPHVMARPILEHFALARYFTAIHGAELDGRNDDKGDLLAHIIAEEGVDPAHAVMIGDRKFDILAARRHGIRNIGVLWGYGGAAELTEAGVDQLCARPADLVALVEGGAARVLTARPIARDEYSISRPPEIEKRTPMDPAKTTCIEDLRRLARRRVPRMFYQYVDSGSWSESTYRANEADFSRIKLRQRVAVDMSQRVLASAMLGETVTMPVAIAPTGFTGMQWADGEMHAAMAAKKAGVPFTLSTMSICSIEDIARHIDAPFWFQLYVRRDREFAGKLIDRAKAAGCSALMVTLDLQVLGQRHNDVRNGLSAPPRLTPRNIANMMMHPRWCLNMLGTKRHGFGNVIGHARGVETIWQAAEWVRTEHDPTFNWDDIAWIRDRWGGRLILKGILDAEDAHLAVKAGADAVVVSNHGGRQLDGAHSTIAKLPEIVAAVGSQTEVHLDGGIRSGQDVLRAIALGAKGTYIGRAYLYGLAAGGEAGVSRALEIIRKELDLTMGLCGETDIANVDSRVIAENPFG